MLDARPRFIIKILKRSLIHNLLKHELSTASLQFSKTADLQSKTADLQSSKTADWQSKARALINLSVRERFRIFI